MKGGSQEPEYVLLAGGNNWSSDPVDDDGDDGGMALRLVCPPVIVPSVPVVVPCGKSFDSLVGWILNGSTNTTQH